MLDVKYIRQQVADVKANCMRRGVSVDVDALLRLDDARREAITRLGELRHARKEGSKHKPTEEDIARMRELGTQVKELEQTLEQTEKEHAALLARIPNMTHPQVPEGGEENFRVLSTHGKPPKLVSPKDHEQLLTELGLIDFERGAKVSGAKFYFALGDLALLNQALIRYGLDIVTKHGYLFLETPDIAKNSIISGIGFSPRGNESQIYNIEGEDTSLIGTAEITVGGFHSDEILDISTGPKKYVALSHCFRTEAGAYGRTSKGLYRVHQFTKLEMFIFCRPEESERMHEELLAIEKEIADGLGLYYRVIDVASRDLGAPAYRKFDLEAWMVMKNDFGEITSTSNCTDYQSRNLNIKYRLPDGETAFIHTLNGTAVTTTRLPIALIEQYQREDCSIDVPKKLQKYMGKKKIWNKKERS